MIYSSKRNRKNLFFIGLSIYECRNNIRNTENTIIELFVCYLHFEEINSNVKLVIGENFPGG